MLYPLPRTIIQITNDNSIFRKEGISTGKFISEKTGLYLISVSIASSTAGARYFVIQDGAPVSYSFVSSDNSTDSGTVVTAIELQANNTVWIEAQDSLDLYFGWSCLTIVRLQ